MLPAYKQLTVRPEYDVHYVQWTSRGSEESGLAEVRKGFLKKGPG